MLWEALPHPLQLPMAWQHRECFWVRVGLGMDPGTCRALQAMYEELRRAFKVAGALESWCPTPAAWAGGGSTFFPGLGVFRSHPPASRPGPACARVWRFQCSGIVGAAKKHCAPSKAVSYGVMGGCVEVLVSHLIEAP